MTITPPPEVFEVVEAGAEVEACLVLEPELLPHAATTNAMPIAATPLAYNLGFL